MTASDALRVFNLRAGCSADQVRQAYLDLVKVWHPDRFQSDGRLASRAEQALREINEAYEVLQSAMTATDSPWSSGGASASQDTSRQAPSPTASSDNVQGPPSKSPLVKTVLMAIGLGLVIGPVATIIVLMTRGNLPTRESTTASSRPAAPASDATAADKRIPVGNHARPESGTELLTVHRSGGGSLVVHNTSGRDAVVALTTETGHERAVYVRAGGKITLTNVAAGTYRVQMMVGGDWAADHFTRDIAYQELDRPVQFVETNDGATTEYTKLTISLQPVASNMAGVRATRPFRIASQQDHR